MPTKDALAVGVPSPLVAPGLSAPAPVTARAELSKRDRGIIDEWRTQCLVIRTTALKTDATLASIATIHQHGAAAFDHVAGFLAELQDGTRSERHQAYVDQFTAAQIQLAAKHIASAIDAGGSAVMEMQRLSLYPADPPKRRGWLRW